MELVFDYYSDSFPYDDGSGAPPKTKDVNASYEGVQYLQPRLAELFQSRIGISTGGRAEMDIALLGAIRLINLYHFMDVEIPPKGPLSLTYRDRPPDAVTKAEDNVQELVEKLIRFQKYLRREGSYFHEAALKTARYLAMLQSCFPELKKTTGSPTKPSTPTK